MRKMQLLASMLCLFISITIQAQQTPTKYFAKYTIAGEVYLLNSYGEFHGSSSSRVYTVDVTTENKYYIAVLTNMKEGAKFKVYVDEVGFETLYSSTDGWQICYSKINTPLLDKGKHIIRFVGGGNMVPMVEEIALVVQDPNDKMTDEKGTAFLNLVDQLKQQPLVPASSTGEAGDITNKVLPNPEGTYNHAIDTSFSYSHFSYIYLSPGVHTITTSGSTAQRALTIFNPSNFTESWANLNSGPGGESSITITPVTGTHYIIMLRATTAGTSGVTNIVHNGTTVVSNAIIGGRTYIMSSLKGGLLNFFTCRLTSGDTRMLASKFFSSSARGFNDDYNGGGGDWNWGYASRIKKNFTTVDSVQYGYVCAYSPYSSGTSDVYLGNENSNVYAANYPEFPLLKQDDAIKAASSSGYYNCISWSGGITASWSWPPSAFSTYNCSGSYGDVVCFDNFYANTPVRYPGAWTYTRTGATSSNATVDLWKLSPNYTHASVRKPGNNHPHGYDWESKPGGLTRTFHPRNALTNLSWGYGAVTDYYKHTGGYGRGLQQGFETDEDAVKAGVAVFEKAALTETASQKLNTLVRKTDASFTGEFNELYEAWKRTWERNAVYSDPAMYCKNGEFEALAQLSKKNSRAAMLLVFDKFVNNGDHLICELLWTLTKDKYAYLLTEVKTERAANPDDAQGRYKIHGDHDNGVLYIEKILKLLEEEADVQLIPEAINVIVSPNPVKDRLTVQVTTGKNARVSVKAVSAQTRQTKILQQETMLAAGVHRFNIDIAGFAGNTGDIIAVQVVVDGQMKTVKVLVTK